MSGFKYKYIKMSGFEYKYIKMSGFEYKYIKMSGFEYKQLRNTSGACEHQSNKIDSFPENNFAATKDASQQHSEQIRSHRIPTTATRY